MTKRIVVLLAVLALCATAGTVTKLGVYEITLSKPTTVSGAVLQPGDYKLSLTADKATITTKAGGSPVETFVKIELVQRKIDTTVITYQSTDAKTVISEIELGGTKTRLVFIQ